MVICESLLYAIILFLLTFDAKECFVHIFVEQHSLNISDPLATNAQFYICKTSWLPVRNFGEGTQNFRALRTQPWYNLLFMLKSHCECTYHCLFNLGIAKKNLVPWDQELKGKFQHCGWLPTLMSLFKSNFFLVIALKVKDCWYKCKEPLWV